MITQNQANYIVNINLHIFIVFTFLTIIFFTVATKVTRNNINHVINSITKKQVDNILTKVDKIQKPIKIDWVEVKKISDEIIENSDEKIPEIYKNNKKIKKLAIYVIIGLFISSILLYILFTFIYNYKIDMKSILIENFILFSIIGILEYIFFTKIISHYVPVTPNFVSTSILERLKTRINEYILN